VLKNAAAIQLQPDIVNPMDTASVFAIAFAIGVIAGLRSLTAPAVVSWAAYLGWIKVQDTWAVFLASTAAVYIFTALALAELVSDKLPKTPSRKTPGPFAARIVIGAVFGAALCVAARQSSVIGAVLGGVGGVAGTLGGYAARTRSVAALKVPDFVIALIEDAVAVGGGLLLVSHL
jgi:uncharacterized membrane protein